MLNPYIKLYLQADENRRSQREIKFPSCDKIKLMGLRRFRSAKKAQTITGQRVNLDL
ncbi:unknown protein [Microcystis aeruginosa NIES-843]|uniref:Uncharacterized protein n=1 Tax=Microcystis aeruginosa (strain NIES-843 / IAM M-2473) TaxID=449447 RepID=B0JWV8_MICAN|nr:unknown protein [Microcystis aeruginosa NIES-843]